MATSQPKVPVTDTHVAPDASAYPNLADYGLIGDCHTAALVSTRGSIDWCCLPRFDSDSCFGRLLDWERGGFFSISPREHCSMSREYDGDSLILVIIMTPLARDELTGPRGEGYRRMIEVSAAGRAGTPDEVATVAALLMSSEGSFITGSDFLMDGGVTSAYWFGELAPQ